MAIYMHIDNMKGSSTDKNHSGWIELVGKSFQVKRNVRIRTGVSNDREIGAPSLGEFHITKFADESSAKLLQKALKAEVLPKVVIDVCKTGQGADVIDQYTMTNVLISHYEDGSVAEHSERGTEYLIFNFRNLEVRHTPYDAAGKAGAPYTVGYDLDTAAVA